MNCRLKYELVHKLIQEFGSPLYVFHKKEFVENYLNLLNTIRSYYPKYNIAYSYKTNYTPKICQIVKELGGLAEVVSDMEFELARKIGYDFNGIIYNGPVKGEESFTHLKNGGIVNVDNLQELNSIIEFAKSLPQISFKIAFRVNIDIGQGFVSRFGIDAYEELHKCYTSDLYQAFKLTKTVPNISVGGLHCHVGKSRSIEAWKNRIRAMFILVDRYFSERKLEFIDFGSGMYSVMEPELSEQFGNDLPSFQDYAEVIGNAMYSKYGHLPENDQPILYTEPGTTLISGFVSFLTTVKSIKRVKQKTFVTFDSSCGNMGEICQSKNLPIENNPVSNEFEPVEDATFVGYTCLEHDHLYEGYTGLLCPGNVIQFMNVGSYSNVFKPPFILPNCAMVQIDDVDQVELIKRKECFEDVFQTYVF